MDDATAAPPDAVRTAVQAAIDDGRVRLYTPKRAGDLLDGVSQNTVYRLVASGDLRAVDVAPPGSTRSKLRIRADDLQAFIEARTRTVPAARNAS